MQVKLYIYLNIYMQAESTGPTKAILFIGKRDKMINDNIIKVRITFGALSILPPLESYLYFSQHVSFPLLPPKYLPAPEFH